MSSRLLVELQCGTYANPLKQFQRDAMLDLILAWGSLDGALTILLAAFTGEDLCDAADRIGKKKGGMKLLKIARIVGENGQFPEIARNFKKQKRKYEKYSKSRDRIAHGYCVGYLPSDDQFIVFAVAERVGDDQMSIEAIPVSEMQAATQFGETLAAFAVDTAEKINAARQKPGNSSSEI